VKRSQYVIPIQCVDHRVSAFCGHSASILCMILSAKITASAIIECRAGDGLVLSN